MTMASPYDQLIQAIIDTGVSEAEAQHAARRCAMAMAKQGVAGYLGGGALSYFLAMNPGTAVPYLVGGVVLGAGHALVTSVQCSEVREAIKFWNTTAI
jgi:hypothetical protein